MNKLIILFSSLLFACHSVADTLSWCAYYNWKPWIYPKGNDYAGILIDQLDMFKQDNPKIQIKAEVISSWKRCQAEVENGNVTMILGANKTEEREKIYDYLKIPAFTNHSVLGIYTAKDNGKLNNINSLEDLRYFSFASMRGDSYGKEVDDYVASLSDDVVTQLNSRGQLLGLVGTRRLDYFIMTVGLLEETVAENVQSFPELATVEFKKISEVVRSTPVYLVFGKKTGNYDKYSDLWLSTINNYYKKVNIKEEIKRHSEQ